jgi:phospholipid transport system transporter-binding protein
VSDDGFQKVAEGRCRVSGAMTFDTAGRLWESSKRELDGQAPVNIDLAAVTEVDSAALALLLEWVSWARQRNFALRFTGFPDKLRALARLSEVEHLLGLEPPRSG